MKLVCIGDSLTYGYGVLPKDCWVTLLKLHFNIEVINQGINGDTISGILSRSYKDIVKEKPDYVIIMAGTNDMLMNHSLSLIKDGIKLLIKEANENNITPVIALQPKVIASLAKIYWDQNVNYEKVNADLLNYINWFKAYAKDNNISYICFYDRFIGQKNIDCLYSDGIHPNAKGHKLMFDTAAEFLSKII